MDSGGFRLYYFKVQVNLNFLSVISAISNVVSLSIGMMIGQYYDGTLLPLSLGFVVMGVAAWVLLYFADNVKIKQV